MTIISKAVQTQDIFLIGGAVMVGPFFYINSDELNYHGWVSHLTIEEKAEKYGDFLTSNIGHAELFDMKFKSRPDIEYFDFPRGRVVYNTLTCTHIIYMDKCIHNKADRIANTFKLSNFTVLEDEHYVCKNCMNFDY